MAKLYVGMVAPKAYRVDIDRGNASLDMTTISACTFEIRKPDGTTTSWSTVISNQLSDSCTFTHNFTAAPSQVDQAGTWHFYAKFTVGGGFDRSEDWVEEVLLEHG